MRLVYAPRFVRRIREAVRQLAGAPGIGRPGRVPGTRELAVGQTPCIAPYRVKGDAVEIITVFHAAQQWPEELP
jgi:toxin ParE1/3/4